MLSSLGSSWIFSYLDHSFSWGKYEDSYYLFASKSGNEHEEANDEMRIKVEGDSKEIQKKNKEKNITIPKSE